jgi:hypothetical protein
MKMTLRQIRRLIREQLVRLQDKDIRKLIKEEKGESK